MKSKIKRHSRSVLAVILTLSMLVSCMMVGIIATDAAKTTEERVGAVDNSESVGGQSDFNWKGNVFFRVPDGWDLSTNSNVYCVITRFADDSNKTGNDLYKNVWKMNVVGTTDNSRLYHAYISADHSTWGQSEYLAFAAHNSTLSDASNWKLSTANCRTATYDYGVNDSGSYMFSPSNAENNTAAKTHSKIR